MSSVLFDEPGPKAKRRVLIASVIAGLLVLGLVFLAYRRLDDNGQFDSELWSPLLNPGDEKFDRVWELLGKAMLNTLKAAALAIAFSLVAGTLIAVTRLSLGRTARLPLVAVVELLRGVPVVIMIFFVSRLFVESGSEIDVLWHLVIGLTLYNAVVISEIVRAGVNSLPRGQTEAAMAIGMTGGRSLRLVQLPQAFRVMLPALISQLVVVLKDTSLGFVILYPETLRQANLLKETLDNPIQMYVVIGACFILVNYLLSKIAQWVERRLSRSSAGPSPVAAPVDTPAVAGA
jgi:glutamate transport system permease protein